MSSLLICAVLAGAAPLPAFASEQHQFNIPAESAGAAIRDFGMQARVEILVAGDNLSGKTLHAVSGAQSTQEGLAALLRGTGLTYRYVGPRSIALVPATSSKSSGAPANGGKAQRSFSNPFRMAQAASSAGESPAPVTQSPEATAPTLKEVVVTAKYNFLSVNTSGATNLPLPIEQVPQSINLVSADFIQAADLKTLGAIAEYTPGAVNAGSQDNAGTEIMLRGFTPDQAVDGIPVVQGFALYEPDYAIYDRLEVVEGPSSVVYGVSSPGGVVNSVTKSATPQTHSYIDVQGGSWNSFRLVGQAAGSLDADGHARAIGIVVRDQGDSFMDVMNHQKTSVYGGLNFDLGSSVTGYVHGGFETYARKAFDGIPTEPDGSPPPVPRSFFIGASDITLTSNVYHTEAGLTWHATDMLEFGIKGNYEHTTTEGSLAYSFGLTPAGDLGTDAFRVHYLDENYGVALSALYRLDDLGMKGSFVSASVLYQNSRQPGQFLGPINTGTANIFDGVTAVGQSFDSLLAAPLFPSSNNTTAQTTTASMQTVLRPLDHLAVLLGASYSKPDLTTVNEGYGGGASADFNVPGQMSYRAGLTYEFLPKTFAYVSYSQSFNPQIYQDVNHDILPPLTGEQYEGGIKYRSLEGRLLLTGALFQIEENNVAEYYTSINGLDYFQAIGEVRHRGVELSALGRLSTQWQINAGYAYLDPRVARAVDSVAATVGQTELYIPKNTFSIFTTYTLPKGSLRGLSLGMGVHYVGSERTSFDSAMANEQEALSPTRPLPGYTIVDASLGYSIGKWLVQLNAHNILNKYYLINNYQTLFYGNVIGQPANFALSVERQF